MPAPYHAPTVGMIESVREQRMRQSIVSGTWRYIGRAEKPMYRPPRLEKRSPVPM